MDVKKVAQLARLKLSPTEEEQYQAQLASICQFFEKISDLNTQEVEPLVTPTDMEVLLREDKKESFWSADDAVKNSPEKSGHLFKVPPVV